MQWIFTLISQIVRTNTWYAINYFFSFSISILKNETTTAAGYSNKRNPNE